MKDHNYFVYITTNPQKTVLYTGVTNDLYTRMQQHYHDATHERKTFSGKYYCYNLVYFEHHTKRYFCHAERSDASALSVVEYF